MTIELTARSRVAGTIAPVIRLIDALDHTAARIAVGQMLTQISARHRRSTDLGATARVLVDLVRSTMERTAADVVVELAWRGEQPVVRIEDTGIGYELRSDDRPITDTPGSLGLLVREGDHTVQVVSRPEGGATLLVTPDLGVELDDPDRRRVSARLLPAPQAA